MSLFPSAFAATANAGQSSTQSTIMSFLPMVIIFILFWFLLIRPQQKKSKLHNQMINQLQKGDEIVTNGGILGKISKVEDQIIHLEIADNVIIRVRKNTVAGTAKTPDTTK